MPILFFTLWMASFCVDTTNIVTGADRLEEWLPMLNDKKVALVVNQTARVGSTHLLDTLRSRDVDVRKIFTPEHGFMGSSPDGERIPSGTDKKTGLPVISLYGQHKKPSYRDLSDIDIVIFDIQDVGVRFYTYSSTLHYVMESCSAYDKPLLLLDRPNPLGHYLDGPILEPDYQSFVGLHPIPIVHGLTFGELARMINGEHWLEGQRTCQVQVITMKHYTHQTPYSLPVKPSPNLPNDHAIALYPSVCLLEQTVMSVGRGTDHPFECIGHPDLTDQPFQFTPRSKPKASKYPPHENKLCFGVDLRQAISKSTLDLSYLLYFYRIFPHPSTFFLSGFDKLVGTDKLRHQVQQGWTEEQIRLSWASELKAYRILRNKYTLYP